jgi:ribosomal protein S12 methylthiotransferase accessory factor
MLKAPRFKPHLRVEVVPGEGAFVVSGTQQTLLKGCLYELVVPWVGDGRTPDDLCDQLRDRASAAEVYFVLGQLERKGYLCEQAGALPDEEAALWSSQQIDPAEAARRLGETTVTLRAFGVDEAPLAALLESSRVRLGDDGALGLVVADGYLRDELSEYNAEALRSGRPWLLVKPLGREPWLGPLFVPGASGCWACLADRLRANRPVESYLSSRSGPAGAVGVDRASSPATLQVAWGLAAQAVASWVARGELPALQGKLQSFDLATWESKSHTLVRLPYCPACGQAASVDGTARPLDLSRRPKSFTRDGGHRVVSPEVTLKRFGHHVSPITGAVSMLERVGKDGDGEDSVQHTYIAGHNLARGHRDLHHLRSDLRNMSSGKGATDVQARASGLCEGLERYSGVYRGDEPRRRARMAELGAAAVYPHDCLLFSERQYRTREDWNARASRYNFVPVPFDPEAEIDWTPAWSLSRREPRYLPTGFCYYSYPHRDREPFCVADSNGNAAGNTLEEAILQGFLELVERDAVALWWYNRVRRPGVDLDAFSDSYFGRLRDHLRAQGRELWAIDLTSDLDVPVFAAVSRRTEGPAERIFLGFGAHLDPRVALLRAVTEMSQMMSGLSDDCDDPRHQPVDDPETLEWLRTATVANQPYLLPDASPPRRESDYPKGWTDDVAEDVRACQSLVERHGMELIVLDQTRPEIGLPVAKVVVPGLRHFWARFAPGRLYDVPARLGWVASPLAEEDLNPIPMFL